ncbi:MAG: phosphotransferase [Clostridiales bacterium]|nr:phosphotransferase [Clostridiales bacterium]
MNEFEDIIRKFQVEGEITEVRPLGHGSVNHTYEIQCGGVAYVLQEINHIVFKYPVEVMNNLFLVTEYLRNVIIKEGRDPDRETISYIRTRAGNQLLQTERGSYFRLYRMICCGEEMQKPDSVQTAYEAGRILGQFHRRLRDFDTRQLSFTMPKVHDMKKVMNSFVAAVRADICFRTSDCQEQIQFVLERSKKLSLIMDAVQAGEIPLRVTHNDTHYSNILVDPDTKKAICLIDLDTVMPGVSILDFGDSVRAAAATYDEDERSGDIELDLEMYRFQLQGYADEMGRVLTAKEKELINYAVWLMCLERGIRYLTDYLNGDQNITDFSCEQQNLYRAVNQFFLVLDIEEKKDDMREISESVFQRN